jgi:hypothetical protein
MPIVTIKSEEKILFKLNEMSELELCTFLEKLNELILDRRQKHLIQKCFGIDPDHDELEGVEIERDEYKDKLENIEMKYMDTFEDNLESLQSFYLAVGGQMPV